MEAKYSVLLFLQILFFTGGRLCDDLSWYTEKFDIGITALQSISSGLLIICACLKIIRQYLLIKKFARYILSSTIKFIISWSLTVLICVLFVEIFKCPKQLEDNSFEVALDGCVLNIIQVALTTFNYSLLSNKRTILIQLIIYQIITFVEIIYNGTLIVKFIDELEAEPRDYSILFISIVIANQALIMDFLYRYAHQQKQRRQKIQRVAEDYYQKMENLRKTVDLRLSQQNSLKALANDQLDEPEHHPIKSAENNGASKAK